MLTRNSVTTIGTDGQGQNALDFLVSRFTYHDRQHWLDEFSAQRLAINGTPASPAQLLESGDQLRYTPAPRQEPPVDLNSSLIVDGGDYAVLNKSGNLPCHPAGCFFNHTLWAQLKEGTIPGLTPHDQIHFVSRLDRETSGLVLVAWNKETLKMLNRALNQPAAQKSYRVLVEGDFPSELEARGWLWTDPQSTIRKRRTFSFQMPPPDSLRPETAATRFRCLGRHDGMSELEAILETGRTHQIRATLSSLGFPVVGDKLYGVDPAIFLRFIADAVTAEDRRRLRMERQALHACRLVLPLSPDTAPLEFTAPVPADFPQPPSDATQAADSLSPAVP